MSLPPRSLLALELAQLTGSSLASLRRCPSSLVVAIEELQEIAPTRPRQFAERQIRRRHPARRAPRPLAERRACSPSTHPGSPSMSLQSPVLGPARRAAFLVRRAPSPQASSLVSSRFVASVIASGYTSCDLLSVMLRFRLRWCYVNVLKCDC